MPSNTNFTVYWAPEGAAAYPAGYTAGINTYFEDLAHDSGETTNVDSVSAQYNDAEGHFAKYNSSFGGAARRHTPVSRERLLGRRHLPHRCADPARARSVHRRTETADGPRTRVLPAHARRESKAASTLRAPNAPRAAPAPVFCAYHGNIPLEGGKELIYTNDPFVDGQRRLRRRENHPNESPSDGALQGGLSHEHNESITDPEPNNAWTDIGGTGGEIGDKCAGRACSSGRRSAKHPTARSSTRKSTGTNTGTRRSGATRATNACSGSRSQAPSRQRRSRAKPGGGTEVQFDATGSTAPGGVFRYNWQFNDGPGLAIPSETEAPTVSHTFPAAVHVHGRPDRVRRKTARASARRKKSN